MCGLPPGQTGKPASVPTACYPAFRAVEVIVTQARSWKPGNIIRAPAYSGGFRVWRVVGVYLGGTAQKSVIEIETLDRIANTQGRMCVPCELLEAAMGGAFFG